MKELDRKGFLKFAVGSAGGLVAASIMPEHLEAASDLPFENGKYQTFPRLVVNIANVEGAITEHSVLQNIDIGTLGPDVDTIVGVDFSGDIPTSALQLRPAEGQLVKETRVVFIKRTDLETVQLRQALGGDRFDVYQISNYGGDQALDAMARLHAQNTARKHQKVVYLGDLGLFEEEWGEGEKPLLTRIIRAQRPAKPELGIQEPDFVNPRQF